MASFELAGACLVRFVVFACSGAFTPMFNMESPQVGVAPTWRCFDVRMLVAGSRPQSKSKDRPCLQI